MTANEDKPNGSSRDLETNVRRWLDEQGYPTEFRAANICRRHKFAVRQGIHERGEKSQPPREIDVVASADFRSSDYLVRIEHVLECKWSKDKPWIVFTSPTSRMAPSACIAQTIGNSLGDAAIWTIAGDTTLQTLDFFCTPERPGFGGRQAFSKGQDHFYSAIAAASELSFLRAAQHDRPQRPVGTMPHAAVLTFPIIVVEGELFEAFFDDKLDGIGLAKRDRVRCHWRGASSWDFITTVDVVTLDHLDEFMRVRASEVDILLSRLNDTASEIANAFRKRTLKALNIHRASRGVVGLPRLLREVAQLESRISPQPKRTKTQKRESKRKKK